MRNLSEPELLSLRELLQMETNGLAQMKATQKLISDTELKRQADSSILAMEGRIKAIQQFVNENDLLDGEGKN